MIEVGEYIRTYDGIIGKVKYVDSINVCIITNEGELELSSGIKNNKERLIDLIEVGDIVEIYDVLFEDVIYIWNKKMLKAVKEDVANGIKIRRILTKEQYEANCYKVKEEICYRS